MKKLYIIVAGIICSCATYSQSATPVKTYKGSSDTSKKGTNATAQKTKDTVALSKQLVRTAANLKSGTSQDVLTSFFKLAYSDLSDGHHFQFNSSLFAVRAKTDTTLWIDTNYRKQVFARNFVFGIDYGLDSNYKFKSASLNVKYAIINHRDKNIFDFSYGKKFDQLANTISLFFRAAENQYFNENPEQRNKDSIKGRLVISYFNYTKKTDKTKKEDLPKRYLQIIDSLLNDKDYVLIKNFQTDNLRDTLFNMFSTASSLLQQTSLWTIGSQVTTTQQKLFNKANFNTEYLKGITKNNTSMGLELDIKGNLDIYDTTAVSQTYSRNVLSGSAGINWIIYKDKNTQKSYVEFKPALTYNNVLSGMLPGETKSKFTGDGVLRFRITDDFWIPIDIKYDPDTGKVLGFLNITANFDWLGGKLKTPVSN